MIPDKVFVNCYEGEQSITHPSRESAVAQAAPYAQAVGVPFVRESLYKSTLDNLTATQTRCTELIQESRDLKAAREADKRLVQLNVELRVRLARQADAIREWQTVTDSASPQDFQAVARSERMPHVPPGHYVLTLEAPHPTGKITYRVVLSEGTL